MNLFDDNCRIAAEYDKEAGGVSMKIEGGSVDVLVLLTMIVDHVARLQHTSGAELAGRICAASGNMRCVTDKATIIDIGALQRAKDKRDGD